jgi:hypothetical protein
LTMLYRSTDRLSRCGAPVKNLAHSASFESLDKDAPSKPGTKHLGTPAFGAVKAIAAASLGRHLVSMDSVVATMRQTGRRRFANVIDKGYGVIGPRSA